MRAVSPRIAGVNEEVQTEGRTARVIVEAHTVTPDGRYLIISRWRPTVQELLDLTKGSDIFITRHVDPQTSITVAVAVTVGPPEGFTLA